MSNSQLFIPNKITVGYQERHGTYSGKLAYVIYTDNKGVLRKETSWKSWRDEKLGSNEYDNKPLEGFVLNKKAGGYSSGWDHRQTYCRIWDPRGFEFEITVDNLLFILQETSCTKGKGLEGEFVYGWSGKDIVLLPAHCEEYKQSQKFTTLQDGKVSTKDLVPGCVYRTKREEKLTYLGKFKWFEDYSSSVTISEQYVFTRETTNNYLRFEKMSSLSALAEKITDEPVSNYADLLEEFSNSNHSGQIIGLTSSDKSIQNFVKENDYRYQQRYVYSNENLDEVLEKKVSLYDTFYLKEGENTYRVYSIHANLKWEVLSNYTQYYQAKVTGYSLTSTKVISLVDGNIVSKAKPLTDDKLYTQREINNMDFQSLKVKVKIKGEEKVKELRK